MLKKVPRKRRVVFQFFSVKPFVADIPWEKKTFERVMETLKGAGKKNESDVFVFSFAWRIIPCENAFLNIMEALQVIVMETTVLS